MKKVLKYIPKPNRRQILPIILVVIEIVVFSFVAKNFTTMSNMASILRNVLDLSIVAIGMTLVMIIGGVDISVGSILGVIALFVGWMLNAEVNPFIIAIVAMAIGILAGLLNGALIEYGKIPEIILTLATGNIYRAAIFGLLGGKWLTGLPPKYSFFTSGTLFGLPVSLYILILFYIAAWYFTTFTQFGRKIFAIGNNRDGAQLNGINVKRVRILTYGILGALVGFASLVYVGRMRSVEITIGIDLPLSAIAATVIGGLSLRSGGSGSMIGTFGGVLFMAIMRNGLVLMGVPSLWDRVVTGLLILVSVGFDILIAKISEKRKRVEISQKKESKHLRNADLEA